MIFKIGDKVRLLPLGTVTGLLPAGKDKGPEVHVTFPGDVTFWVAPDEVQLVEPVLGPGDKVRYPGGHEGMIIATHGQKAWVQGQNGDERLIHISNLSRLPA
ncbi:MAG TPA: hypothetical protein VD994_11530 [Prosthecobacter sp.]|nr:hypothetical protein [Prosthecobacter sp.]